MIEVILLIPFISEELAVVILAMLSFIMIWYVFFALLFYLRYGNIQISHDLVLSGLIFFICGFATGVITGIVFIIRAWKERSTPS